MKYSLFVIFLLINSYLAYKLFPSTAVLNLNLALGGFGLLVLIAARLNLVYMISLWFLFLLFSKSTVLSIPIFPDISAARLIWIIISLSLLSEIITGRMKGRITITSIEVVMFGLVFYILVSKSMHGMFDIDGKGLMLNPLLAAYVFPFSMFIFSKIIIDDEKKIKILFICFSLIGLYLGLTGIFEYFHLRQFVFPKYIMNMWLGGQWGRARGPLMSAAVNGTVIGMIIIMLIHLILQEKIKWKKIFFIISVICSLTTLVFTLTRGCWISFAISLFIVTVFISRVRYVVIPGFLALVLIVTFLVSSGKYDKDYDPKKQYQYKIEGSLIERIFKRTSNVGTVTGRFDLYNLGWAMFLERPFFGYGFGTFQQSKIFFGLLECSKSITEKRSFKKHGPTQFV